MKKLTASLLALLPALALAAEPASSEPKATAETGGGFGLLLQGWFEAASDSRFNAGATKTNFGLNGGGGQPNAGYSTFRLRRTELSWEGKLGGIVGYRVMADPSIVQNGAISVPAQPATTTCTAGATAGAAPTCKTTLATTSITVKDILQDAWFSTWVVPYHEVRLGQMKIPVTMEGFGSSGKLDFAERSIMGRTFGDQRDLGLMVLSQNIPYVEYQLGVFNGLGKNVYDNQPTKDVAGRLVFKPIKGVSFGGSGYQGGAFDPSFGAGLVKKTKNRGGVEAAVEYAGFTVKGEWMGGRDGRAPDSASLLKVGGSSTFYTLFPVGYYVTAGYRYGEWQLVARYDHFDSDGATPVSQCKGAPSAAAAGPLAGDSRCQKDTVYTVGLNYDLPPSLVKNAKLQLDYYRSNDDARDASADELFFVTQLKF